MLIAFVSIAIFLLDSEKTITARMLGVLQINHAILGSYYVSFYLLCGVVILLDKKDYQWLPLIVVIGFFVLFAQSRGAYLALVVALVGYFLLFVDKNKKALFIVMLITCAMCFLATVYWEAIIRSGFSYRPEIVKSSIELVMQNFWLGHGVDFKYLIYTDNYHEGFLHTHNLLAHLFIELGMVGVLLFLGVWCYAFYFCYKNRHLMLSRLTCTWFIYSFVAFQTDAASFIAQPRLEWIVCWVPLCLVVATMGQLLNLEKAHN